MNQPLTLAHAALLTLPIVLWAGNAIVGRLAAELVPPITLNFMRWVLAAVLLLPLAGWVLRPGSGMWRRWRRYALLGFLSVTLYNALQYLALRTSTPVNVTLVASSMPVFMMGLGALFFGQPLRGRQVAGAMLSMAGVVLVLARGDLAHLAQVRFVAGDLFMLLATASWAWYSWLLTRAQDDDPALRAHWAPFLMAQMVPGIVWAGLFTAAEWQWAASPSTIQWGWPLLAILVYVAIGPSLVAYRAWGLAVQRVGPSVAGLFSNLTPLFAATMSALFLGEMPRAFHAVAFLLIAGGILVATRRG